MKTVHVYVEGPSDRAAMEALLAPLLSELRRRGVAVHFYDTPSGDRKKAVLLKVPERAVSILRNRPHDVVVALPDLYPKNHGFPHSTPEELVDGVFQKFRAILARKGLDDGERLENRFRAFCFKHDLEALVLAAFEPLKARLGAPGLRRTWSLPVEDVDHGKPPKRVVEELFREQGQSYRETVDAPLILGSASYNASSRSSGFSNPFDARSAGARSRPWEAVEFPSVRRITLITTGGTIEKTYDEVSGDLANRRSIVRRMLSELRLEDCEVNVMELMSKDSLDMNDADRDRICQVVRIMGAVEEHDTSGIVILHGTDRLAITGERLLAEVPSPRVPIVLTGAMRPFEMKSSDALQNLTEALFAAGVLPPGVYCVAHGRALRFPGVRKDPERGTFVKD